MKGAGLVDAMMLRRDRTPQLLRLHDRLSARRDLFPSLGPPGSDLFRSPPPQIGKLDKPDEMHRLMESLGEVHNAHGVRADEHMQVPKP